MIARFDDKFYALLAQAQRLYRTPQAQQRAVLGHCRIMLAHSPTSTRWVLWHDRAAVFAGLDPGEVRHD